MGVSDARCWSWTNVGETTGRLIFFGGGDNGRGWAGVVYSDVGGCNGDGGGDSCKGDGSRGWMRS